jgi:hypothetical protein
MTNPVYEQKWLIGAADELAAARTWLKQNVRGEGWHLELLGLEEDGAASGGARIAVSCTFQNEADAAKFGASYLAGPASNGRSVLPPPPAPETEADAAFADSARRILEGPEPISAGKLHFLGLEKVRAHFGDAWPKMASRAEALVRRAIERRLSPLDVYRKTGDLNFVVVFGSLGAQEAETKCALIGEEITRMLVGDELGKGMLAVKTLATDVSGAGTLRKLGRSQDIAQAIEGEVEIERLRREPPSPEPAGNGTTAKDPLDNVKFVYRPIWDVKRSAVANFYLLPGNYLGSGHWRYGDAEVPGLESVELCRRLDDMILRQVVLDLQALQRQGRRLVISFPVHFESVSTPTRRSSLLERWRTLSPELRKLGVFEIVGAPEGVPQGRLAEIVNYLRTESRGVLVRVPLTTLSFRSFTGAGILAIGAELGPNPGTEERLMGAFREFVANAERARLVTYIHGLRSFSLTIGAIGAGFSFVDGDPVSSISEHPEEAYRFGLEDLYAQRLSS